MISQAIAEMDEFYSTSRSSAGRSSECNICECDASDSIYYKWMIGRSSGELGYQLVCTACFLSEVGDE